MTASEAVNINGETSRKCGFSRNIHLNNEDDFTIPLIAFDKS